MRARATRRGTVGVTEATASRVTLGYFRGTLNCPADTTPVFQKVTYTYNAADRTVERDPYDGAGAQPLTSRVVDLLTFQYFDCAGATPVATLANIARIEIRMDTASIVDGRPLRRDLVSSVRLRNKSCLPAGGL